MDKLTMAVLGVLLLLDLSHITIGIYLVGVAAFGMLTEGKEGD